MFGCTVYESGIVATIDTWNSNSAKTNTLDNNQVYIYIFKPQYCHNTFVMIDSNAQGDICQNMARIHDGRIHCK